MAYKKKEYKPKPCLCCGEFFIPKSITTRFCSRNCNSKYARENTAQRYIKTCVVCGVEYSTTKKNGKCCGRSCSVAIGAKARGEQLHNGTNLTRPKRFIHNKRYSLVKFLQCEVCGEWFRSIRGAKWCCSCFDDAGKERKKRWILDGVKRVSLRKRQEFEPIPFNCAWCGKLVIPSFGKGERKRFCSGGCSTAFSKKIANGVRRAKKRASGHERVNYLLVFNRDRWRCQLCGKTTIKSKRGTTHPRAPELDHIVPLSKGGSHTYQNTQCACRSCNNLKGSEVKGQLRLC